MNILKLKEAILGYLKGYKKEALLVRQIFTNKDGSIGILNLVCSDTSLSREEVATIYKKRWKVEKYHKSLKSNAAVGKLPTKTIRTQVNHIFLSIIAILKLNRVVKNKAQSQSFCLKGKIKANQIAFAELQRLKFG